MATDLRSSSAVVISAIIPGGNVIPMEFARNFQITRNFQWTGESGIGHYWNLAYVLHFLECAFNMSRATLFNQTLTEIGIMPRMNQLLTFKECDYQIVDILSGATMFLIQMGVISGQTISVARATTISENMNGMAQNAISRDEIEGGIAV